MRQFTRAQDITGKLESTCKSIGIQSSMENCDDLIKFIKQNLEAISSSNILMKADPNENQKRKRRAAPLNIIGWIGHEVFGIMDAEQAEQIENQFNLADQKSDHQLQLIKNQTSLIESTVNLMKVSEEEVNQNYIKIEQIIGKLTNESYHVDQKLHMMTTSMFMLGMVNRSEKIQGKILDILTDLHQGHVSSQLFTPNQFRGLLQIVLGNLPVGNVLPEIAQHDIKSLYKLIRGTARVTTSSIIVDIIFPLVSGAEFQILRVIPIPTEHHGSQITIIPEAEYLLMTLKQDYFYQVSEKELRTCMKLKPTRMMCHLKGQLFTTQSAKSLCEREILTHTDRINPRCKFDMTKKKDF